MKIGVSGLALVMAVVGCTKQNPEFQGANDPEAPATSELGSLLVLPTQVFDERRDEISFTGSGVAFEVAGHMHDAASAVMLGVDESCPEVFKHAYLMTDDDANAIRVRVQGTGVDATTARYRVRSRDGVLASEFRPVTAAPSADGTLEFNLTVARVREPFVASYEGELELEVFANDAEGTELRAAVCWTNHPLPAPLKVTLPARVASGAAALAGAGIAPADRHVMAQLIEQPGLQVMELDVCNAIQEPATLQVQLSRPPTTARRSFKIGSAFTSFSTNYELCTDTGNPSDNNPAACASPVHPTPSTGSSSLAAIPPERYGARAFALTSTGPAAELACESCDPIAGNFRFALGPRACAHVVTSLAGVTELRPVATTAVVDTSFESGIGRIDITGAKSVYKGCTRTEVFDDPDTRERTVGCIRTETFTRYTALTLVELAMNGPLAAVLSTATAPSATFYAIGDLATAQEIPAQTTRSELTRFPSQP